MVDVRYSTGKEPFSRMNTQEMRKEFLITDIFRPDDISCVYSHIDRIVVMGAMPVSAKVDLQKNTEVSKNTILYKCGWSPFEGTTFSASVEKTFLNGCCVYDNGTILDERNASQIVFNH